MVQITDSKSLDAWLRARPREDAVLIGARAALRVLPLIGTALNEDAEKRRAAIVLPTLRAAAVAGLAGKRPRLAIEVSAAAYAAARAAARAAAHLATHDAARDATRAAARAAYAAARDAAHGAAREAAHFAAVATGSAARAAGRNTIWHATSLDATALDGGTSHEDLGATALWMGGHYGHAIFGTFTSAGTPTWSEENWRTLKRHLDAANEGWEVWTDWYDAVLQGLPLETNLELAKMLISDHTWQKGPSALNAQVARLNARNGVQKRAGASASREIRATDRSFEELLTDTAAVVRGLPDPQVVLPSGSNESVKGRIAVERAPGNAALRPRDETANAAVARPDDISTVAFFSYTRSDDRLTRGIVSAIRKELQDAVSLYHGAPLDIFQDQDHIQGGDNWRARLEQALAEATIFVPLITPAFFNSVHCREELARFLARGDAGTLVLPIHFIDTDFAASEARDELRAAIEERQWLDWRPHQRQTRINKRLRDDIHRAARLILTRWRAARPDL